MSDQDSKAIPDHLRALVAPAASVELVRQPPKPRGNPAWRPGTSGNPSGRPKGAAGLARYVAEQTDGGREIVDRLLGIMRRDFGGVRDQLVAISQLLDRLVGKPLQTTDMAIVSTAATDLPVEFDMLSPAQQVARLREMRARAALGSGS